MSPRGLSRRRFLGLAGTAAGGVVAGAGVGIAVASEHDDAKTTEATSETVAFGGVHQAGIVTSAQDRLHIAAFDVVEGTTREQLRELLEAWSQAARRMTAGGEVGAWENEELAPPVDTGEAYDLPAARLTVTIGFGPGLFDHRFGLQDRRPKQLVTLPALPGDALDPERSGGDICVQACADDPQVAFHAVRNLARIGRGTVVMRWSQLGFGRTSKTTSAQATPRNLMGFKDGTKNITAEETADLDTYVWAGREAPAWMTGGTYMVTRRIRMLIEVWDRANLQDQEKTIGRTKVAGAPLGTGHEFDVMDLKAKGPDGQPLIPVDAHVRLAAPETNGGVRLLRRGYSFTDGFDSELGQLDAGLFFIAFQRDPQQFIEIQNRLGGNDALNEYIKHTSSAVFAVPGGVGPRGGFVGDRLFS